MPVTYLYVALFGLALPCFGLVALGRARHRFRIVRELPRNQWLTLEDCEELGFSRYPCALSIIDIRRSDPYFFRYRIRECLRDVVAPDWERLHPFSLETLGNYEFKFTRIDDTLEAN